MVFEKQNKVNRGEKNFQTNLDNTQYSFSNAKTENSFIFQHFAFSEPQNENPSFIFEY